MTGDNEACSAGDLGDTQHIWRRSRKRIEGSEWLVDTDETGRQLHAACEGDPKCLAQWNSSHDGRGQMKKNHGRCSGRGPFLFMTV